MNKDYYRFFIKFSISYNVLTEECYSVYAKGVEDIKSERTVI